MMESEVGDQEDKQIKTKRLLSAATEGMSHGQLQKISQEGGKNTYVLILSKDYLKSENSKGQSLLKCMTEGCKNDKVKHSDSVLVDSDFDSPSETVSRKKLTRPPEDVKLNLSNINDEDYDSKQSANSVFLQEQDSAIDVDHYNISNTSRNYFCEKSQMNTYIIPSPLRPVGGEKPKMEQHTFKTTSPLKITSSPSSLSFQPGKSGSQTSARKIVLVTPTQDKDGGKRLKKSVTYSNEAVPVMGRGKSSFQTPISLLPNSSSKAIPTFSNLSPINQQSNTKSNNTFVPISIADSLSSGPAGPFTSTPVTGEPHRRLQQIKQQESSTHRSVYVIPSPFSRQTSTGLSTNSCDGKNLSSYDYRTPSLNNSSGFISGSSSLDTPDVSRSFDGDIRGSTDHRECSSRCNSVSVEVHVQDCLTRNDDGSGGVVINVNDNACIDDFRLENSYSPMDPSLTSLTSSQESESGDNVEKAGLNRSLTNIQWLKGMMLEEEKSQNTQAETYSNQQHVQWTTLSPEEIQAISAECGRDKRPPFSYMSMIQMALYSRTDRKMMLKEICKWIEDTFPYYRFTAKPGWRNSIRHNLSLYNIFERETTKRHGSYWTLKSDVEPRTKSYHREKPIPRNSDANQASPVPPMPSQIPIIPIYSTMGQLSAVTPQTFTNSMPFSHHTMSKKKGPPPILPRPGPYTTAAQYGGTQRYALIPVPMDASLTHPGHPRVILNLPGSANTSACPSPIISEVSAAVASIQVSSASPIPQQEQFCDSINYQHDYNKPISITKQAWISCQNTDTTSSVDSDRLLDAASSTEIASSNEFTSSKPRTKSKRPRVKPGLPKPTMYKSTSEEKKLKTSNKRRKLQQKALVHESSDEDEDGSKFISNIEKEIFSHQYMGESVEHDEIEELMTTSTPAKSAGISTMDLPSPICGLTPFKSTALFDTSFLDNLTDRKLLGLSPEPGDGKKSLCNSPRLDDCLSDFHVLEGSPVHTGNLSNHNLSRILNECGLDSAMMDNVENFPNLSWSAVQQMVDSMPMDTD